MLTTRHHIRQQLQVENAGCDPLFSSCFFCAAEKGIANRVHCFLKTCREPFLGVARVNVYALVFWDQAGTPADYLCNP